MKKAFSQDAWSSLINGQQAPLRSRRTMLYVAANNARQIEKSRILPSDSLLFDLQESVGAEHKEQARDCLRSCFANPNFELSERILRINPAGFGCLDADLELAAALPLDGILIPEVERSEEIRHYKIQLKRYKLERLPLLINIESPLGIINLQQILAEHQDICTVVIGTEDLAAAFKLHRTPDRFGLIAHLSAIVLAARAHRRSVIDGPHFDISNEKTCELAARQGRNLGFDGKAIIHPCQIAYTNDVFTPRQEEIEQAQGIAHALLQAREKGSSRVLYQGQLINPHRAEWALRIISIHQTAERLLAAGGDDSYHAW